MFPVNKDSQNSSWHHPEQPEQEQPTTPILFYCPSSDSECPLWPTIYLLQSRDLNTYLVSFHYFNLEDAGVH